MLRAVVVLSLGSAIVACGAQRQPHLPPAEASCGLPSGATVRADDVAAPLACVVAELAYAELGRAPGADSLLKGLEPMADAHVGIVHQLVTSMPEETASTTDERMAPHRLDDLYGVTFSFGRPRSSRIFVNLQLSGAVESIARQDF